MSTGSLPTPPGGPAPARDYHALRAGWRDPVPTGLRHTLLGEVAGYPVDRLDLTAPRPAAARLLLAAGTHGDEPAGPIAMARLLADGLQRLAGRVDVVVLPCINPWGFVHDRRENADGVDINRAFEDDGAPEAALLKSALAGERFDLFLEFHEDWEYAGYYLFECRDGTAAPLGARIVEAVRSVGPICDRDEVDDVPLVNGVAAATAAVLERLGERVGQKALPLWLFRGGGAAHTVTTETPSSFWDLERRIAAHRLALDQALRLLLDGEAR